MPRYIENPNKNAVRNAIIPLKTPHYRAYPFVRNVTSCPDTFNVVIKHQQLLRTPRG